MTTGSRPESVEGRTVAGPGPGDEREPRPGFDTLGLALTRVRRARRSPRLPEGQLEIEVEGAGAADVPRDASHLVVRAIAHAYASVGRRMPGSACTAATSSRTAGAWAPPVRPWCRGSLAAKGLLEGDVELVRRRPAASRDRAGGAPRQRGARAVRRTHDRLGGGVRPRSTRSCWCTAASSPLVFVPDFTMSTQLARSLQPLQVPREDAVFNVSRLGAADRSPHPEPRACCSPRPRTSSHQNYRARGDAARPAHLVRALRAEGFAAVVSGAGPSVLVLADGPALASTAAELAASVVDTPWRRHMLAVDVKGGTVRNYAEGSTELPHGT